MALRQNLQVQKAPAEHRGSQGWLLHDPVTSRHFKLGEREVGFLRYLSGQETQYKIDEDDVEFKRFLSFLSEKELLSCNDEGQRKQLEALLVKKKQSRGVKSLLARYLSLRIPLFRSDRFLTLLLMAVRPLLGWYLWVVLSGITFAGFYMTVNQWGRFSNTFFEMISPGGFACFVVALLGVKFIHELGHGLVAKYFGCYVPTVGVTFLVFWPVLYTDTTSAWRLSSYRQRFLIGLSGMIAEIIVAVIALFLWHFLPPGAMKSICFLLATTTWVLSLAVNFNPLMRFDGYFLLADWWQTDNLMSRSLALGGWYFRRVFWGMDIVPPEQPQVRMIAYGWCCWIYRILLTIGISLVVYHLIYKPLGIFLMVSLMIRNIGKPMFNEGRFLIQNISKIVSPSRFTLSAVGLLCLCLFFFLPIQTRLTLPALISGTVSQQIYMPLDGQLVNIENKGRVEERQQLYQLYMPDLDYQLQEVNREKRRLQWQLNQSSVAGHYLNPRPRIKSELLAVTEKLVRLEKVMEQNRFVAPFGGFFQPTDPWLKPGSWVKKGTLLGILVDDHQIKVEAYLSELDRDLLNFGSDQKLVSGKKIVGRFYPDNGLSEPIEILLESVGAIAVQQLNHPELASVNGGSIGVNILEGDRLVPVTSYYLLRFSSPLKAPEKQISGVVILDGETHSLISRIWQRIAAVFRKEADI